MNNLEHFPNYSLSKQQSYIAENPFLAVSQRRDNLLKLAHTIESHTDSLLNALKQDLGKCDIEAYTSEIGLVLRDIHFAVKHLHKWMKPRRKKVPLMCKPGHSYIQPVPLGVILIIGPWNYPFQLLFSPMVAALAAGNAVCLKPSEYVPSTTKVIRDICSQSFSEHLVSVVEGDNETSSKLVSLPFDHIFFTGSTHIGKLVAGAASKNLTPVTLELGGKSPCIVCEDAPLTKTALRIMWGKCLNAGQTCVAPDHVWVHHSIKEKFLHKLKYAANSFVPFRPPDSEPIDYAKILNDKHFERLEKLIEGANIYCGGERNRQTQFFSPTVLTEIDQNHPLMQEEIFGPLLPVLSFNSLNEVIDEINDQSTPLAAYLFTKNKQNKLTFEKRVNAGGICINDTISHILPPDLPFGGLGASGYGSYRGKSGFDRLSHLKSILHRGFFPDLKFRYPPYDIKLKVMKRFYKYIAR